MITLTELLWQFHFDAQKDDLWNVDTELPRLNEVISGRVYRDVVKDRIHSYVKGRYANEWDEDDHVRLASIRRCIPHMVDNGGVWPRDVEWLVSQLEKYKNILK
jgi:hypothetical protein